MAKEVNKMNKRNFVGLLIAFILSMVLVGGVIAQSPSPSPTQIPTQLPQTGLGGCQ